MWRERAHLANDPLMHALKTVMRARYNTKLYVQDFIHNGVDDVEIEMRSLVSAVQHSTSSSRIPYVDMN